METLKREALLKRVPFRKEFVELGNPGEGIGVYIREMNGRERDNYEQSLLKEVRDDKGTFKSIERNMKDYRAKLVVACACDEEGNPIFLPDDVETLSKNTPATMIERMVKVAQRLNGMNEEAVEDVIKNSAAVQDGSSSSDSVVS